MQIMQRNQPQTQDFIGLQKVTQVGPAEPLAARVRIRILLYRASIFLKALVLEIDGALVCQSRAMTG
jgi:hypothetical protein